MASKAVEIILKAKDLASGVVSKLTARIKTIGKSSAESSVGTNKLSGSIAGLTARIGAFVSVAVGFALVKKLFIGVISTGSKFETLQTQLDSVTGSAEAGEEAFAWIKDFTKETPLQLDAVAKSFVKLKAFGLDPMDGTMQSIVDSTAKLGGGQEKLNGVVLAVGQAWAKQKLQGEEILQLVERGIPVWDLLAKATGKNTIELNKLSEQGKLGRDVIKLLIEEMGSSSLGAAAAQMKDASGIVSNLKDQFVEFLTQISDQGALEYFKDQLKLLSIRIKEMTADGSLQELAKNISDFMISAAENTKAVVSQIVRFSLELKILASAFVAVKVGAFLKGIRAIPAEMIAAASATAVMSKALIATGWGAVALAIGFVINKILEYRVLQQKTAQTVKRTAEANRQLDKTFADLSEKLGIHISSTQDLRDAQEKGLIVFDKQTKQWELSNKEVAEGLVAQQAYKSALEGTNPEIDKQAAAMVDASLAGKDFNDLLKQVKDGSASLADGLKKLTDEEFAHFVEEFNSGTLNGFVDPLVQTNVNIDLVTESMRRLSIDAELLATGFTSAGKAGLQAFDLLVAEAHFTGKDIVRFIGGAIDKIGTNKGLEQLKLRVRQLGIDGELTGKQVAKALKDIEEAAKHVEGPVKDAYDQLRELNGSVDAAKIIDDLDAVGIAAGLAWRDGIISAEQHLETMQKIDAKKKELIATTQKQAQEEKNLAKAQKEANEDQADSAQKSNAARSVSIVLTERETRAQKKSNEIIKEGASAISRGSRAIFNYAKNTLKLRNSIVDASEQAEKLADRVTRIGESSHATEQQMAGYVHQLEQAIRGGKLLDEQSLSKLQSALDLAKSKMQALKNETQSAASELASLQGELAGLNGDEEKVQQLQFEQRRLELKRKIAQAEEDGNSAAVASFKQSLALLSQINKKRQADIRAEKQQQAQQASKPAQQDKTVRVKFESPEGQQVSANIDARDESNLFNILKQSGAATR